MWLYVQMWFPIVAVALTAAICFSVAVPKIEAPAWSLFESGRGFYVGRASGRILGGPGVLARLQSSLPSELIGGALEIMEWRDTRSGRRTHAFRPSAGH